MDGAYIGTTFPHLFFMTYASMIPDPPEQTFVPRVFGFRVHASAANGALARGHGQQHDQHLQERRRLRQPPPSTVGPGAGTSRAAESANGPRAAEAASPAVARAAGATSASPASVTAVRGVGRGRADGVGPAGEGEAGRVVVRIKAEEDWSRGQGAGAGGSGGAAVGGSNVRRDSEAERRRVSGVDLGELAGAACRGRMTDNGRPARCVCVCVCHSCGVVAIFL